MRTAPLARFDSSATMVETLGRFLHGRDFPALGLGTPVRALSRMANVLPTRAREAVYALGGWAEGIPARSLARVRAEDLSRWAVSHYPAHRAPAVMIGSSNGAAVHLAAAFGIPWLPQTFLVLVRRRADPDDPSTDVELGRDVAGALLDANPDLQLHQMHDPNQDRLMLRHVTYFRIKRRRLGAVYERFLQRNLAPGGTIVMVECGLSWPSARLRDRHFFQPGALGGLAPEEYVSGGPRVRELLRREGSDRERWDYPQPDVEVAEAEWGFEPSLGDDVGRFAAQHGYQIQRLTFDDPTDLSPTVADVYRTSYRERGVPDDRLVVPCFFLLEPWWTLRTASVPFWTTFSVTPSLDALDDYLDRADPYNEIWATPFCHGVDSVGMADLERWRSTVSRAVRRGGFLGLDEDRYPRDFAVYGRYHDALRQLRPTVPMPEPLPVERLVDVVRRVGG